MDTYGRPCCKDIFVDVDYNFHLGKVFLTHVFRVIFTRVYNLSLHVLLLGAIARDVLVVLVGGRAS